MNIEVRLPQIDDVRNEIRALSDKIDALALALSSPGPVRIDVPLADQPSAPKARRAPRAAAEVKQAPPATEAATSANGEAPESHDDEDEDVETQRARVVFEGKRVARTLGIGGMRAAIKRITGENILQIDDVPAGQLAALLTELQAL